jgi:endogenous inhibitor of DNA gyrase (YacG/DUF329 family)
MNGGGATKTATGRCAMCGAPVDARHRPFCSARCKDLDLGRWLTGSYAVPVVELDERDVDQLADLVHGVFDAESDADPGEDT